MASPTGASEVPVPEEMDGGGGELPPDELAAFRRFQRYMRQPPSASTTSGRGKREESEEDEDNRGGAPGPPPSWDGTGVFEDYLIKAKLWIATTKSRPRMRGPLLLKALTSTPFETFKHYAQDAQWLADPKGAEKLLDDMNRPEHFGDDRQEHMLTAMSRITFHMKRNKSEHWRSYFARWETALRKVHEHKIRLPEAYEGFLLINGLQLTDTEVKAFLNYSRGDISPASIKDWLRTSESRLNAQELGSDKKKAATVFYTEEDRQRESYEVEDVETAEDEELRELEAHLMDLQDTIDEDEVLDEGEAAEVLATMIQQRKKTTYAQSLQKKKDRELGRGYQTGGKGGPKSFKGEFRGRISIEEVKQKTRCKSCGQIGHWHKDAICPNNKSASSSTATKEVHFISNEPGTKEAFFVGYTETLSGGSDTGETEMIEKLEENEIVEQEDKKETIELPEESDIMKQDEKMMTETSTSEKQLKGHHDAFCVNVVELPSEGAEFLKAQGHSTSEEYVPGVTSPKKPEVWQLFFFEDAVCKHTSRSGGKHHDSTCATLDTGCQRLAIGKDTLTQYGRHLPEALNIAIYPEVNRFRSVHDTSSTTHSAAVPCSLGINGCYLKPAIFEEGLGREAPFLISLSFLSYCKAQIKLDPHDGYELAIGNRRVACHLGPTGALRIPLQEFTPDMIQKLNMARDQALNEHSEFEILSLHGKMTHADPISSSSTARRHLPQGQDRDAAEPEEGTRRRSQGTRSDYEALVPADAKGDPGLAPDQRLPCPGSPDGQHEPKAAHREHAQQDDLPGVGEPQAHGDRRARQVRLPEDAIDVVHSGSTVQPGSELIRVGQGVINQGGECGSSRDPELQCLPAHGVREHWRSPREGVDLRTTSEVSLPGPMSSSPLPQTGVEFSSHLLAMRPRCGGPVPDVLVDVLTTVPAAGPDAGGSPDPGPHEAAPEHDLREVRACRPEQDGIERQVDQGEVQDMREGLERRGQEARAEATQDGDRRAQGIRGLPGVATPEGELSTEISDRLRRKLRAALKHAVSFWRSIQLMVSSFEESTAQNGWTDSFRKLNDEICREFLQSPQGTKVTRRAAEVMRLTHEQLKSVTEVFNPGCFNARVKRHGLGNGQVFDLAVGVDLLKGNQRSEVRNYIKSEKPGLVLIAPPCQMFSSLQNLSRGRRERSHEAMSRYLASRREAKSLLAFAVEIGELCCSLGLKFVFEHPASATSWQERELARLRRQPGVHYIKADQCYFGLRGSEGLHRKPTGFLTNSREVGDALDHRCRKDHSHEPIIGGNKARRAQEYPVKLIDAILAAYARAIKGGVHHVHWFEVDQANKRMDEMMALGLRGEQEQRPELPVRAGEPQRPGDEPDAGAERAEEEEQVPAVTVASETKELPLSRRFKLQRLLQRAHEGLGHPHPDRFLRILRYAKASPEIMKEAKELKCSVCERHKAMRPARRAAPPREIGTNEVVGIDVIYLPTVNPQRSRPALNIIDWGTKFQLVIPLRSKRPEEARAAYRQWLRFFGPPKTLAVDLGREFKGIFMQKASEDGSCVDPSAVEAPYQRAITERHGKTIKFMLLKAMDQYNCKDEKEWEVLLDMVCMMKNRLMHKNGYSPVQRVLGYSPRIPGGILTEDSGNETIATKLRMGDLGAEKAMLMRKAAAHAFMEADCSEVLRRAISSGPRVLQEFDIGEVVYFYRMGADAKRKYNPSYWQGPGRVVMIDGNSVVWIAYNGFLVKTAPERVRRASMEENLTLTGWIDEITETRRRLEEEPKRGLIDLVDEHLPEGWDTREDRDDEDYMPEDEEMTETYPPPTHRLHSKTSPPFSQPQGEPPSQGNDPLDDDEDAENGGMKRPLNIEEVEEPVPKRSRLELLEMYYAKVEKLMQSRTKKEIRIPELSLVNQACFRNAIDKEIQNNISIGAYRPLTLEESTRIRQVCPDKVMESRFVLTAKPLDPEDVEAARNGKILLDWPGEEPCKAKARHVMKGYSEEGAEQLDAATPQVTREGALFVTQMVASHRWNLGFMDFTQAFHSGDLIERELYAEQPREGIPTMVPGQLLRLEKTCYGLTDGPLAWYRHLRRLLVDKLGYKQSLADPCIFLKHDEHGKLAGIIAVATDDLLHGGTAEHLQQMEEIKKTYKLGKYQFGSRRFTGKNFTVQEDGSILIEQEHYTKELKSIEITRNRKRQRFSPCTEQEISQLRGCLGALSWLAKETRPDLAGRTALLQQAFPQPRVRDLVEANAIVAEAQKYPNSGIRIMPIEPTRLRVGVATDASWANSRDKTSLEDTSTDRWEETENTWIRHHTNPRQVLFHPAAAEGPDIHRLQVHRQTILDNDITLEDTWNEKDSIRQHGSAPWTGKTIFQKLPPGEELPANAINETFLQLLNSSSQGGFIMMFYDQRLETENKPHYVSITNWKSTRLKRKTVNTLSAECQSLIHGVGHIHWHRYLLVEALNLDQTHADWEARLASVPYVAVVDSKSLFDCLKKLVCTYAQVDDKRTAIDVAILKDEMQRSGGHIRWVEGTNMVADSLTKKMSSDFLRMVCNNGHWALTSKGHTDLSRGYEIQMILGF